jgi:PAS domain S-box-containing protein
MRHADHASSSTTPGSMAASAVSASETANQDLRALQAITDTALSHLSLDDLLPVLLERLQEVLSVDNCAVLLLDPASQTLAIRMVRGPEEAVAAQLRVPVGQGFAGRIAATREPLVVDDLSAFPVVNLFLQEQLRSVAGVPLIVDNQLLGVVHIGTVQLRHFTSHEVQLLQQVADRIALAIDRAHLYTAAQQAREVAEAAQARAEAALARAQVSEYRYQRLVEANIIGVTVTDSERVLEANDTFLRLLGYTQADVQAGRLHRDTLSTPDTRVLAERTAEEAVTTGASAPFEREYVRKDGSRVSVLVAPVLLQRDPVRLVNFVLDLTERNHLGQALAERVAQLEAVMEAVPYALAVYDTTGRVILSNAVYQANVPAGETLAERIQHVSGVFDEHGVLLEEARWPQTRALQGEVLAGMRAIELTLHSPDGELIYSRVTAAPLRDQAGSIIGVVTLNQNITEQKRLEHEREAAHASELAAQDVARHLDSFLATAAHDIRSPVTVISGQVQVALRRAERMAEALYATAQTASRSNLALTTAAEGVVDSLRSAQAGAGRLRRLVDHLFDVAQAQTGRLALELVPCDLAALVRRSVALQQAAAPERHIDLATPAGEVPVEADADRLDQVLSNYLINALKYSAHDQPVAVRLSVVKNLAVVSVEDHGPGLPPEEQRRVWEPFHRAPGVEIQPGSTEVGGSLGLGLHICKQLIELHPGGSVGVESVVGEGSTFWFRLPLARTAPSKRR